MEAPSVALPQTLPVMALSGVTLFPHALLPLYIFEPRYQKMLDAVLAGDRIFAVGMVRPDTGEESIFPVAGAGLVRACVGQPDGTSQLILQGIGRVRFDSFSQTDPYLVGRARPVETVNDDQRTAQKLGGELQEICAGLVSRGVDLPEQFTRAVGEMNDPAVLGDVVAQHLVREPLSAQQVLGESNLSARLRRLVAILRQEWQQFPS
ncbi:MAG: LON peptidase substrate-binding domain-containing protein [Chthoniobacterales bacterium]|jgi:Lon protease-like protein